jgi:hypothetical protein
LLGEKISLAVAGAVAALLAVGGILTVVFWGAREGAGILIAALIWVAVVWRARQRVKASRTAN